MTAAFSPGPGPQALIARLRDAATAPYLERPEAEALREAADVLEAVSHAIVRAASTPSGKAAKHIAEVLHALGYGYKLLPGDA